VVEIISRSGLRSDCGSFHNLPGPFRGPGLGKTCVSLGCVRPPQAGPIGCSSPRAPLEGWFRVWPSGSLETRPRWAVPRYSLRAFPPMSGQRTESVKWNRYVWPCEWSLANGPTRCQRAM